MEKKLEDLIAQLEQVSYMRNLNKENPVVLRFSHPSIAKVTTIVCAQIEPDALILPLNVVWIDLDPQSENYRRALGRVSKDAALPMANTWELLETYDAVFVDQYYDTTDTDLLTSADAVSAATTSELGTVRLSAVSLTPDSPVVVVEGDVRLSDPRAPKAHSHAQEPASALRTQSTNVIISGSVRPQLGDVLIATSPTSAEWRAVRSTDIVD